MQRCVMMDDDDDDDVDICGQYLCIKQMHWPDVYG